MDEEIFPVSTIVLVEQGTMTGEELLELKMPQISGKRKREGGTVEIGGVRTKYTTKHERVGSARS